MGGTHLPIPQAGRSGGAERTREDRGVNADSEQERLRLRSQPPLIASPHVPALAAAMSG